MELLVKPLTVPELQAEADAWMALLQEKTRETSQAELAIRQKNKAIDQAEEVQEALEDTQEILDDVEDASREARDSGTASAAEEASELAEEARETAADTADTIEQALTTTEQLAQDDNVQQALETSGELQHSTELTDSAEKAREATEQVSRAADETAAAADSGHSGDATRLAEKTMAAVDDARSTLVDTSDAVTTVNDQQLEKTAEIVADLAENEMEDKKDILVSVNELKAQRTALVDRLSVVVDELSKKLGRNPEGKEHEFVVPYRLYASAVSDIAVDVSDTQALWSNIVGWLGSEVGGLRLARHVGKFLLTVFTFWVIGMLVGKILDKALAMTRITVELMRSVIVRTVRRGIYLIGIIIGLSAMDINIGPILAVVGAAGFVVAFALQNTLSNFASGIMIMIYRPYDVGDIIKVGGVIGRARSMNLVNTTIATFDNQLLIVPNNTIWGDTITNITGSDTRRVDLLFGINYEDEIETALRILREIVDEHPLVLKEPEPLIAVQELAEYTVNIICWSWSKTGDYWRVYRDITRSVKERFEAAGMETPYPKHNIRSLDTLEDTD